ncbi:MAG: class I SAM-dependent methyltransferase [Candidatus Omnitrophica bacterium]|nr:class I SAM-dependent methyltransferase [Candidatus Omnitrophota bacterium]
MNKKNGYYEAARLDLIRLIPAGAKKILEVGCGSGVTGLAIKDRLGAYIEVTGVELNPDAASKAKCRIDTVLVGDVETLTLPFEAGTFDCIIYGDVLEHLKDPWGLLKRQRPLLTPGGCAIASIPNIAHYRILKMLRKREWRYEDSGILDRSHLRFFTIRSIETMFDGAGFDVLRIERKLGASKVKRFLNALCLNAFVDSLTEQYLVVASQKSNTAAANTVE